MGFSTYINNILLTRFYSKKYTKSVKFILNSHLYNPKDSL